MRCRANSRTRVAEGVERGMNRTKSRSVYLFLLSQCLINRVHVQVNSWAEPRLDRVLFLLDGLGYLRCFVVLFFMDLKTRRVEIGGIANSVNGRRIVIARNLTDVVDGFFAGKRSGTVRKRE